MQTQVGFLILLFAWSGIILVLHLVLHGELWKLSSFAEVAPYLVIGVVVYSLFAIRHMKRSKQAERDGK